jgi:hypothetical protein
MAGLAKLVGVLACPLDERVSAPSGDLLHGRGDYFWFGLEPLPGVERPFRDRLAAEGGGDGR